MNPVLKEAGKILRLFHLTNLRKLQSEVNDTIELVQSLSWSKVLLRILKLKLGWEKLVVENIIEILFQCKLYLFHSLVIRVLWPYFHQIYYSSSLSKICTPKPGPTFFSLVIMSLFSFISSTCSVRKSDSRKSQKWGSLFFVPDACKSKIDWLTVFSSSKADSNASNADPHSSLFGLATSLRTTLPPRLFYKKLTFSRLCNKIKIISQRLLIPDIPWIFEHVPVLHPNFSWNIWQIHARQHHHEQSSNSEKVDQF